MNFNKNEAGNLLPMTVTEGLTVNVLPYEEYEYLMTVLSLLDMENNVMPMPFHTLNLLIEMMPDWQTAKQLTAE